jgi:hypothetical protein
MSADTPGAQDSLLRVVVFFGRDFTTRFRPGVEREGSGRRFKAHAKGQTFLDTAKNKSALNRKK